MLKKHQQLEIVKVYAPTANAEAVLSTVYPSYPIFKIFKSWKEKHAAEFDPGAMIVSWNDCVTWQTFS